MIEGVILKDLVIHRDERGALFEILRSDEKIFKKFGQAYVTSCKPGWVKGWHYHLKQDDFFCVIKGRVKIVLYDRREKSPSYREIAEYFLEEQKLQLLVIPRGVVHGFECLDEEECLILNLPTEVYNRAKPDEYRLPLDSEEVPYRPWKNRQGW